MDEISILQRINVVNPGVPQEEDAQIEVPFNGRVIKLSGKQAWDVLNRRNMALSMLEMANKVKRDKKKGVNVDDIVLPYVLKEAKKIWSILELQR